MKQTVVALLTFISLCLIIGCSADRSNPVLPENNPVLAKISGTSVDTAISWTGNLIAYPCNDQLLSCTGSMNFRVQIIPNGSDGWHITSHMTSDNFIATNQTTGTTYRVKESSTYSAEVRPPQPIVSTQTIKIIMRGSDGSRFHLHCHLHITIDKTGRLHMSGGDATAVCS